MAAIGVRRTVVLAGGCTIVSHTLSRQTYSLLITAMEDDLGFSHQRAGYLFTAIFFAYLAGVAMMTVLSGRLAPKRTLVAGLCSSATGFVVLGVVSQFGLLAVGFLLAGLGSAGIWLSVPTIATSVVAPSHRGTLMGYLSASMGVGLVIIGQVVRLVRAGAEDEGLWRPFWIGAAVFSYVVAALVAAFMPTDTTEAFRSRLTLSNLRAVPGWIPLTGAFLMFGLIVSSFSPFLGPKLEEDGFSRGHVSTLFSLLGLAAIGAIAFGRLSDRVGRKRILIGAMTMVGVSSLLIVVGREPYVSLGVLLNGAASFSFPVMVAALIRDHVSDRTFSNALGAITLIYGVSLFTAPLIAGPIGDSTAGFDLLYVLLCGVAAVGVLLLLFLPADSAQAGSGQDHSGPAMVQETAGADAGVPA